MMILADEGEPLGLAYCSWIHGKFGGRKRRKQGMQHDINTHIHPIQPDFSE
jgi:hypothetical protein